MLVARTIGCAARRRPPSRTWTSSRWNVMSSAPTRELDAAPLGDEAAQPRCERRAARLDPDERDVARASLVALDRARARCGRAPSRSPRRRGACLARGVDRGRASSSRSFPASLDRVKGRAIAAYATARVRRSLRIRPLAAGTLSPCEGVPFRPLGCSRWAVAGSSSPSRPSLRAARRRGVALRGSPPTSRSTAWSAARSSARRRCSAPRRAGASRYSRSARARRRPAVVGNDIAQVASPVHSCSRRSSCRRPRSRFPLGTWPSQVRLGLRRGVPDRPDPGLVYSGLLMSEALYYPVATLAVWALARLREADARSGRRSPRRPRPGGR